MRRTMWAAAGAVAAAVGGGYFLAQKPAEAAKVVGGGPDGGPAVPVTRVALFSAGVGHFTREGEVDGDARIDLMFQARDINDLLKSLTVQDLGGGRVAAVSYDSLDPVERTLKSFAVDLTGSPAFEQLLGQLRGEKVDVALTAAQAGQPAALTGQVIGVERQKVAAGKDGTPVEAAFLNLWCADGARSVKLADVQKVRFLNPRIEAEFRRALDTLALSHDSQKKAVRVSFSGEGRRPVRVGYVTETPVWKTSYRLVLTGKDKEEGKKAVPYLQGWAVVDNPSDEDWQGVKMALVSGRPVSFRMDLYQPLYVPRPEEHLELFASLRPPSFDGVMDKRGGVVAPAAAPAGPQSAARKAEALRRNRNTYGYTADRDEAQLAELSAEQAKGDARAAFEGGMNLAAGVRSAAIADRLGESFRYVIDQPVTLPRQKSALLPIAAADVAARRLSVYNPTTHPKFPMLGMVFHNTTGLHLMQGPVAVFEGSVFAGDAKLPDLQPDEKRLVAYAVDTGTEVEVQNPHGSQRLTSVRVRRGILEVTNRLREERTYAAANRSPDDKTVWVEHPYRPEMTLVSETKPVERSRAVQRFELDVPAGKTAKLVVAEERDQGTSYQISNTDDNTIRHFIRQPQSSEKVKAALQEVLARKDKLARAVREAAETDRELKRIAEDQDRIRKNLAETPQTAAAYKKYLAKLDAQEGEVDKLTDRLKEVRAEESKLRTQLDEFLLSLDLS